MELYYRLAISATTIHWTRAVDKIYNIYVRNGYSSEYLSKLSCDQVSVQYFSKRIVKHKCDVKDCNCICIPELIRTLTLLELRDFLYYTRVDSVASAINNIMPGYLGKASTDGTSNAAVDDKITANIDFVISRIEKDLHELDHDELRNSVDIVPKYSELLKQYDELEAKHKKLLAAFKSINE